MLRQKGTTTRYKDATEPVTVHVTQEVIDEAKRLHLNGRQLMALACVRPTAPDAPVVVVGKSGTARINEGRIEIGGRFGR
jgi:hypothetical protein